MFLLCSHLGAGALHQSFHPCDAIPGREGGRGTELRQQGEKLSPKGREGSPREASLGTRWAPLPSGILPTGFT